MHAPLPSMIGNFGAVHSVTVPHGVTTVGFVDGIGNFAVTGSCGSVGAPLDAASAVPVTAALPAVSPTTAAPIVSLRVISDMCPFRSGCRPESCQTPGQRQRNVFGVSRIRITRAGTPATTALSGTSVVRTELVPITALSPTLTPRRTQAP